MEIFCECSSCKRNILTTSSLWADKEKRICVCCECFGHNDEGGITDLMKCRRGKCKLYGYRDHDFITDAPDVSNIGEDTPEEPPAEEPYDEMSNKCYGCRKELVFDYYYINAKFSYYTGGKFESPETKSKLKAKFCKTCFEKQFAKLKLLFT